MRRRHWRERSRRRQYSFDCLMNGACWCVVFLFLLAREANN